MARGLADYVKDVWNSIFNAEEEKAAYSAEREKLEEFLEETESSLLPEKPVLPDIPVYERMEYEQLSDDELKSRAESEFADFKNQSVKAIESEIDVLNNKYEADKKSAASNVEVQKQGLEQAYDKAKESTANDVLKRGLARSSIAVNKMSGLDEAKTEAVNKINAELSARINELDNEISALNTKCEVALNDFNIAYASKLTTAINALKSEQEKNKAKALEFNNSLIQKEHAAAVDKQIKENDLYDKKLEQKVKEDEMKKENKIESYPAIYDQMRQTLLSVSPSTAKKMLKDDPIYRSKLNDAYYYKLYDEFGR